MNQDNLKRLPCQANCQRKHKLEAELALVEYYADKANSEGRFRHFEQYFSLWHQLRKELREAAYCRNCPHQTVGLQEARA